MSNRQRQKQYEKYRKAQQRANKLRERLPPPRRNLRYRRSRNLPPPPPGLGFEYDDLYYNLDDSFYGDAYYDEEGQGPNWAVALVIFAILAAIGIGILVWFYSNPDTQNAAFYATFTGAMFLILSVLIIAPYLYYYSYDSEDGEFDSTSVYFKVALFFGFLGILGIVMIVVAQATS